MVAPSHQKHLRLFSPDSPCRLLSDFEIFRLDRDSFILFYLESTRHQENWTIQRLFSRSRNVLFFLLLRFILPLFFSLIRGGLISTLKTGRVLFLLPPLPYLPSTPSLATLIFPFARHGRMSRGVPCHDWSLPSLLQVILPQGRKAGGLARWDERQCWTWDCLAVCLNWTRRMSQSGQIRQIFEGVIGLDD